MTDVATAQVIGKYRLDSVLGRGAMGVVYRAYDQVDERIVALKTIRTDLLAGAERDSIEQRFGREAALGMRLQHRNIVSIFDSGKADGTLYLAMEMVHGRELRDLIEKGPPLALEPLVGIVVQMLEALDYAHRRGVVHRDIKPSNVLIDDAHRVKLMDFGIAHVGSSEMTQAGELLGTPAYMSPEQLQGIAGDARADIFSAGVVLYYLLTRQRPFTGSLATVMHQVLFVEPPEPSNLNHRIPTVFDVVIRRSMAKQRDQRYATAADFAEALRAALAEAQAAAPADNDEATVVMTVAAAMGVGTDESATDTMQRAELDRLVGRIAPLIEQCLAKRATEKRLSELRRLIADWHALAERLGLFALAAGNDPRAATARVRMAAAVMAGGIEPLQGLIMAGAPVPGRPSGQARSDWHALVGLFMMLRGVADRLGLGADAQRHAERIALELSGAVFGYSNELNRMLFSDDEPDLMRLAADFMRLEIIQLALEEIGAEREVGTIRGTMLMFASQVMRKANMTIARFTRTGDSTARLGVASLLAEVEELIVMASRLLERDQGAGVAPGAGLGGEVVAEFIENARALARLTVAELREEVNAPVAARDGDEGGDGGTGFAGKIAQLGSLYRFATRLPGNSFDDLLRQLTGEVHALIIELTGATIDQLRRSRAAGVDSPGLRTAHARLTALYDLAGEVGWSELARQIMTELRDTVVRPGG